MKRYGARGGTRRDAVARKKFYALVRGCLLDHGHSPKNIDDKVTQVMSALVGTKAMEQILKAEDT